MKAAAANQSRIRRPRSLAVTLAASFIALSAGALLLAGGLPLAWNIGTQRSSIIEYLEHTARNAAVTVEAFIQEQFRIMETSITLTDPGQGPAERQREVLESVLSLLPAVRQLALLDARDREMARVSRLSRAASGRIADRLGGEARQRIRQGRRYASPVFIDPSTSEPIVLLAVRVTDVFGDDQGTLAAEVNLRFMWDLVARLQVGEKGQAYVVDRRGNLIAYPDSARVLKGENVKTVGMVRDFIENTAPAAPSKTQFYTGIKGELIVGTYYPLQGTDWAVVTETPWEEAYRAIFVNVTVSLAVLALVAAAAGLCGVYLARRLSIPLVDLMETAARIAGGERNLQAAVKGPRELAGLAAAFNSMTDQLHRTLEGLERSVENRTRQLKDTLDFQGKIMAVSATGILVYNSAGQCIVANEASARMINASVEQVLAQNFYQIDSWKESGLIETAREAIRSGSEEVRDVHLVSTFGQEVWLNCRFIAFESNGSRHLLLTLNDMTERMRTEAEIKALNRDLTMQAGSLAAVNQELESFSYSVSHDLRAPLRAINGYTRLLSENYAPRLDAEGRRICAVVCDETLRMGKLIDDLLAISRVGRAGMRRDTVDMEAMVRSVFHALTTPEERKRIDFHIAPLAPARGDETLLQKVWMNLLSNAIKFTSKKERAVITVGCARHERETVYSVRDNGAGFEMKYASKLFGVFQRLHSELDFEGNGVGLAIVSRAVSRHEGRVWAEGEKDKGAAFYFTLPETGGE